MRYGRKHRNPQCSVVVFRLYTSFDQVPVDARAYYSLDTVSPKVGKESACCNIGLKYKGYSCLLSTRTGLQALHARLQNFFGTQPPLLRSSRHFPSVCYIALGRNRIHEGKIPSRLGIQGRK